MTPPDAHDPVPEPRESGCAVVEHGGEGGDVVEVEAIDRQADDAQAR